MKKQSFFLLFFALLFSFACEKEDLSSFNHPVTESSPPDGMMILGEKIENPYSVENMKKAYESLKSGDQKKALFIDDFEIKTTHLYLRILPRKRAGSELVC